LSNYNEQKFSYSFLPLHIRNVNNSCIYDRGTPEREKSQNKQHSNSITFQNTFYTHLGVLRLKRIFIYTIRTQFQQPILLGECFSQNRSLDNTNDAADGYLSVPRSVSPNTSLEIYTSSQNART